jgi:hypothetical protein
VRVHVGDQVFQVSRKIRVEAHLPLDRRMIEKFFHPAREEHLTAKVLGIVREVLGVEKIMKSETETVATLAAGDELFLRLEEKAHAPLSAALSVENFAAGGNPEKKLKL